MKLFASDRCFLHLVSQRGDLEHLARDRGAWLRAYWRECFRTVEQLVLEARRPRRVLDIGSGLGGVDVALMKVFRAQCTLVDCMDGGPAPLAHDVPFGNFDVTSEFMRDNDIRGEEWNYVTPEGLLRDGVASRWDVVLSTRSWCFHYAPEVYLDFVRDHLEPFGAVLVDVRKERTDWQDAMSSAFTVVRKVQVEEKFERTLYTTRREA